MLNSLRGMCDSELFFKENTAYFDQENVGNDVYRQPEEPTASFRFISFISALFGLECDFWDLQWVLIALGFTSAIIGSIVMQFFSLIVLQPMQLSIHETYDYLQKGFH